jgi:hypothetical protein
MGKSASLARDLLFCGSQATQHLVAGGGAVELFHQRHHQRRFDRPIELSEEIVCKSEGVGIGG